MPNDGDTVRIECRICLKMCSFLEMQQILPCFHLFCRRCITVLTSYQKINQADSKKISTDVMTCPATNCYSQIRVGSMDSLTLMINYCDNMICPKKLSQFESIRLIACQHELCNACLEESLQRQPPTCIVENCNRCIAEVEVKCNVKDDCERIALNGFPSNSECCHDVCIECLTDMISSCEASGIAPMCPHPSCHQYYTIESVNALRTLFPQKAEFFQRFDLSERKAELFSRDDSVTFVDLSSDFDFASRRMTVRVVADNDEKVEGILIYDKQGTVGDFIREVRRVLKILPYEKIYKYFIKHENDGKHENETDQEIDIDAISLARCISELHLTSTSIVHVDTAGIVQRKSSNKTNTIK
uniref:RING-type domain-containing protein n=1 Tax=Elaeophora elaphi TaxID=1147741 RepID=A0A0R3S1E4_9BILA